MKKVLILNGGWAELPLIEEAKAMGFYVITSGKRPELMGHKYGDEYVYADYSDKEQILGIVQEKKIDYIISNAHDYGIITAAYVAEKMGWKGHDTYENTLLMHQKDLFKKYFDENKISSPSYKIYDNIDDAYTYLKRVDYPVIVKATDQASGIGISVARCYDEGIKAVEYSFGNSRKKCIIIEQFIEGEQESIVAFVRNKKVVCSMACNCYSPINPYLIQTETMPSTNFEVLRKELCDIIESMFEKLNLVDGIITLQYIVKNGKPYIIELMRRCLGNQFLTPVTAVTGFPWYKALVMTEMGMDTTDLDTKKPDAKFAGHHAIMAIKNGIYEGIFVPDNIKKHTYKSVELAKEGELIKDYTREKLGFLYYEYDTREELDYAATHFNDVIKVIVEND